MCCVCSMLVFKKIGVLCATAPRTAPKNMHCTFRTHAVKCLRRCCCWLAGFIKSTACRTWRTWKWFLDITHGTHTFPGTRRLNAFVLCLYLVPFVLLVMHQHRQQWRWRRQQAHTIFHQVEHRNWREKKTNTNPECNNAVNQIGCAVFVSSLLAVFSPFLFYCLPREARHPTLFNWILCIPYMPMHEYVCVFVFEFRGA